MVGKGGQRYQRGREIGVSGHLSVPDTRTFCYVPAPRTLQESECGVTPPDLQTQEGSSVQLPERGSRRHRPVTRRPFTTTNLLQSSYLGPSRCRHRGHCGHMSPRTVDPSPEWFGSGRRGTGTGRSEAYALLFTEDDFGGPDTRGTPTSSA